MDADVCVIGAGYAGLTAARRLRAEGRSVVVLEARDRVGGRIWTQALSDGSAIDRGGAFLAPGHDAMHSLAREFGIPTYKTWTKGAHLLISGGLTRRYTGLIPKISPLAVATIALTQMKVDRMAKRVPIGAPWDAPDAAEWDTRTIASWLKTTNIRSDIGRDLFEMAVRGLFCGDLNEVSFLHLLFLVRSAGSINTLFSIKGGYQENLVEGGAGSIAQRMAEEIGPSLCVNAPVRSIVDRGDGVVVSADGVDVSSRAAIVAIPPALSLEIGFDPPLDTDRSELYRQANAGPETKTIVVYEEPFWREDGLSGQTAEPGSAAEVTLDATPMSGGPGVIASFTFGPVAQRLDELEASERKRRVLDALSARFGPLASSPTDFIETAWWTERWTRGCSMAHFPPGLLTRYGHLLRQSFGRIHWAGTETATISHGAMDGAVRSGERAAEEVAARL